jgi:DNA-binding response OmpR family regulator
LKALVIEDDAAVAAAISRTLERGGTLVDVAATANEGQTLALVGNYDAIVLDLGLPDKNGMMVIQALRRDGADTPILVLTGSGDSETTVRALDAGADEYLTKPFKPEEFNARIRALVRRGGANRSESLTLSNLVLNRLTRQLLVDGTEMRLTAKEFLLLEQLILHADEVVSRSALLEKVWDTNFDPGTNVVDVGVSRVRKKLRAAGADVHIESRRGMGFLLAEGTAASDD